MNRPTKPTPGPADPALLAESILRAMERGGVRNVATERIVLVSAAVRELSISVMRMPRVRVGDLEGAEVHLYLLNYVTCRCT